MLREIVPEHIRVDIDTIIDGTREDFIDHLCERVGLALEGVGWTVIGGDGAMIDLLVTGYEQEEDNF